MKRPLVFYPVNVALDHPDEALAEFVSAWRERYPAQPLISAALPHGAQVYLVVGSSADLADEVLAHGRSPAQKRKRWPDLPVIWADGGPVFYRAIDDFTSQTSITRDDLLREVYGTLSRQALVAQLTQVLSALDDASSVVEAGEGEAIAYESELHDLRALLKKLQAGAYLMEEPLPALTPMTLVEYLALPAEQRPVATYLGETVEQVYRDPTYSYDERYVIRLGGRGLGSKFGNTLLEVQKEAGHVSRSDR